LSVIENLQEENKQLSNRLEFKQRQLKDTLGLLQRARTGVVGRCVQERALCAWKMVARTEKNVRLNERLALKLRSQKLSVSAFGTWWHHVQAAASGKLVAHERATADMVRAKLFEQMEMERMKTTAEMERLSLFWQRRRSSGRCCRKT
jgi:hypothetical protein